MGNTRDMLAKIGRSVSPVNGGINVDFIKSHGDRHGKLLEGRVRDRRGIQVQRLPENTDVWLRDATVVEEENSVVKFGRDVHLNCVGAATAFRIGGACRPLPVDWTDIVDDTLDVPVLSGGSGKKALYVQVLYNESNIRVINIEYKDP